MKKRFIYLFFSLLVASGFTFSKANIELKAFDADNPLIQYFGRIDFSNKLKPRIWAPGVYIKAKFKGNQCEILIDDEVPGANNHNYLEIVIDDNTPYRIKLNEKNNVIKVPDGLSDGEHTLLICKDTESNTGYIDFLGLRCEKLLPLPAPPTRMIEYFGDSITSGTGMDLSTIPCDKGQWYDQHNAYMSYGAQTSRNLNAQWQLSALAGVGLVHSCCDMGIVMPQIYDKDNFRGNSVNWDFKKYQPGVVAICLGQNDGKQDSVSFCTAYVKFISALRERYPQTDIICLNSPMADSSLTPLLKRYLTGIVNYENGNGDKKVYKYFFSKRYHNGCGGHPDIDEHKLIANELTAFIKQMESW